MTATAPSRSGATARAADSVISVRGVRKYFPIKEGVLQRVAGQVKAVDGVSLDIPRGETVGLVGESGCGKSTLGRCISGLLQPSEGGIYFRLDAESRAQLDTLLAVPEGMRTAAQREELTRLDARHRIDRLPKSRWREYRRNCQVVFQDAFASLNPRHLVTDIVGRPLKIHREAFGSDLTERVVELLNSVGLGREHLYRYPHQFSGGQRQRISIARALALEPEFIVLDEPTSALDVSVQAQILNLLHQLQQEHGLTYLFITHDLGVVRHMSDRITVMYLGQFCEQGPSELVFADPRHPYTEALLAANPDLEHGVREPIRLAGTVPDPARPPQGCRFHTRCPVVTSACGWEVDDVVRQLDERSQTLDGLSGVERHSAFDADLVFDSEQHATELVRALGSDAPQEMREAMEVHQKGTGVTVRFREVDPVRMEEVGPDRLSACILHTRRDPRPSSGGRQHA